MQKIIFGLSLSLAIFVGACGGTVAVPPVYATCVEDNTCVALNYSLKCCAAGKTLQKDETNCPVRPGLMGGMPMRCMPVEQECVQENTCVAANPTLKCCAEGKTLQVDDSCKAKVGFGGMTSMCK